MSEPCPRAYVVCRLEPDDSETPLGTVWCEDWGDAVATARTLYRGPILVRASADSLSAANLWLDAWDREAAATNAENEAIRKLERQRRTEQKVMAFLQWLYPDPNLRPD